MPQHLTKGIQYICSSAVTPVEEQIASYAYIIVASYYWFNSTTHSIVTRHMYKMYIWIVNGSITCMHTINN